ncbi:amino acid adenylation domain-containing protein [Allokutzneria sp. A3M-2-11 16]|uniref:non-ribosomal peptide synthetase n=1 Tax=Allokutzneria sp. A3M-2-11 16 TaxID=2962043 RepID=UPI0020B8EE50|nr:non-ribosomal peptide synthetase [Allokutzneria sp. A3M-2-11 16]MCP3803363.1 amino acid adenylation domain-containing protein [Allokutzneria sp. A3M-2-11 16]
MTDGVYEQLMRLPEAERHAALRQILDDPAARRQVGLSAAQRRLWFLERMGTNGIAYSSPAVFRFRGEFDLDAFRGAFTEVCQRHEVLRARFVDVDGEPVQLASGEVPRVEVTDAPGGAVESLVRQEVYRPFAVGEELLLRCRVFVLGPADHVVVLNFHHSIVDGWSMGIVYRELAALYGGFVVGEPVSLPPLGFRYVDFAAWESDVLDGEQFGRDLDFWRGALAGAPQVLDMPTDFPRPARQSFRGATVSAVVPAEVTARVRELGQQRGMTLFMVLVAAYSAVLSRYSGQDDVLVGAPVAGRSRPEFRDVVGLFVNTVVLRADLSGAPTFDELLLRVRRMMLDAYDHQDVPLDRVVQEVGVEPRLDRNPLFQAFIHQDERGGELPGFGAAVAEAVEIPSEIAKFDLNLFVAERADGALTVRVEHASDLFDPRSAAELLDYLAATLAAMAERPSQAVADLPEPRRGGETAAARENPARAGQDRPPASATELAIAEIWQRLLGATVSSVGDNFFSLGGRSLVALRLVFEIKKLLGVDLEPALVFEEPTLLALAEAVDRARGGPETEEAVSPEASGEAEKVSPLSFAQRRMWFLEKLGMDGVAYSAPEVFRISGVFDLAAFRRAFTAVCARHESLRTRFVDVGGEPVQVVSEDAPQVVVIDAAGRSWETVQGPVEEELARPFAVGSEALARCRVFVLGPADHVVVLNFHHSIVDGWSMGIVYRELAALYGGFVAGEPVSLLPLGFRYADYAAWEAELLQGERFARDLDFWRGALAGAPQVLDMPTDFPRPARQSFLGDAVELTVDAAVVDGVREVCRDRGMTLIMVVAAAYSAVLSRYSGQDEILLGAPVAGRSRPEFRDVVGLFVNTIVLRADVSGDPSLETLLDRVRRMMLDAYRHQDVPLDRLVEELAVRRRLDRNPLFQAFVSHEEPGEEFSLPGTEIEGADFSGRMSKFDLDLAVSERGDGSVHLVLGYATDLFERATATQLLDTLVLVLRQIRSSTELSVGDAVAAALPRPVREEQVSASAATLHELIERQAAATPHAEALVHNDSTLSYRELDDAANALAARLRAAGVGRDVPVGVCLTRTPRMVVAILAVLKAGGGYLPLDPEYPDERLAFMLADSGAPVMVTETVLEQRFPSFFGVVVLADQPESVEALETAPADAASLAYVLYTSGSTGRPKGVAVEHRNVVNLVEAYRQLFAPGELDRMLGATSVCFDASILELFAPLATGGTLVLVDTLFDLLTPVADGVTAVQSVPSMMQELLRAGALPASVRLLCIGGEPLPATLVERIYASSAITRMINIYGPTETTVDTTWAEVPRGTTHPLIGRPIANARCYVLDDQGRPLPRGARGELYIGGPGVARGYLGRPDLNERMFLPDPFSQAENARMYRTGDLVREQADGQLDFLGRTDRQVKIRGVRVEVGEIEAAVLRQPGVAAAVVAVVDGDTGARVIAYVVPAATGLDHPALLAALRAELPSSMVPSDVLELDAIPFTTNGKLDTAALPRAPMAVAGAGAPLSTPVQRQVARLWGRLLDREVLDADQDFFGLGGHSLAALRMVSLANEEFGVRVGVSDLITGPTVAEFAEQVELRRLGAGDGPVVVFRQDGAAAPVVFVHAVGGSVLGYRDLAGLVEPDRPVFGVEARGLLGGDAPLSSVAEMAEDYLDALEKAGVRGDMVLVGWSMGGAVAHEMAVRLAARGARANGLVLIDSSLPMGASFADEADLRAQYEDFLAASASAGRGVHRLTAAEHERGYAVFAANVRALDAYRPEKADVDVLYLCARESAPAEHWRNWEAVAGRSFRLREIPGDHFGVLSVPANVRVADETHTWLTSQEHG